MNDSTTHTHIYSTTNIQYMQQYVIVYVVYIYTHMQYYRSYKELIFTIMVIQLNLNHYVSESISQLDNMTQKQQYSSEIEQICVFILALLLTSCIDFILTFGKFLHLSPSVYADRQLVNLTVTKITSRSVIYHRECGT